MGNAIAAAGSYFLACSLTSWFVTAHEYGVKWQLLNPIVKNIMPAKKGALIYVLKTFAQSLQVKILSNN